MTAVGVKQPSPSAGPTCGHCGAEVPPRAGVRRGERTFCCGGCAAAAELLPDGAGVEGATDETAFAWFEDPAFIADHVSKQGPLSSCRLSLDGLRCGSCVAVIERLPATLPGVLNARVRLDRRYIDLVWDEDAVGLARIAARLHEWGYEPSPYVGDAAREARSAEDRRRLVDIGIAGACAGNAMLIAVALYCGAFEGIERGAERLLEIASAVLGLVAVVGPGRTFFRGAVGALRTGRPHMDLPVSFGLTVGTTAGLINALRGSGEIYFDSLAALVFFLLVGRYLQFRQLRVAADRVANLKRLVPPTARRVGPDGVVTVVPAEAVAVGDLVEVRAGDVIPVDGVIAAGDSSIDRSL
ncbi:MAG: cation transporter, partial [Planctomycetota bacterium]